MENGTECRERERESGTEGSLGRRFGVPGNALEKVFIYFFMYIMKIN